MAKVKVCHVCGREYSSRKTDSKYCSRKCVYIGRPKRQKVRKDVTCKGCGVIIHVKPSEIRRGKGNYCTRACYFEYRKRTRTIECEKCGVSFERHNINRRYCSRACFEKALQDQEVHDYRIYLANGGYPAMKSKTIHRVIAERVLGRPLKEREVVHHINCNKLDYRNSNLLICTQSYHRFLHDRMARKYAEVFLS